MRLSDRLGIVCLGKLNRIGEPPYIKTRFLRQESEVKIIRLGKEILAECKSIEHWVKRVKRATEEVLSAQKIERSTNAVRFEPLCVNPPDDPSFQTAVSILICQVVASKTVIIDPFQSKSEVFLLQNDS